MANGTKTPQDEDYYNRTQDLYNRELSGNPVANQDQRDSFEHEFGGENYKKDARTSGSSILADKAREQEENPDNGFYKPSGKKRDKKVLINLKNLKKRGPLTTLIVLLFGGGIGIAGLASPALMLVHIEENLVTKFDSQNTSMTIRANKLIAKKISGDATSGACTKVVILCKFTRPSSTLLKSLSKSGIQALDKNGDVINPKSWANPFPNDRPSSYQFMDSSGKPVKVSAANFSKELNTNSEFRAAFHRAYNPRFIGYSDSVFRTIETRFGFKKTSSTADAKTTEDVEKTINDDVKGGSSEAKAVAGESDEAVEGVAKKLISTQLTGMLNKVAKAGKGGGVTAVVGGVCLLTDIPGAITATARAFQMAQVVTYAYTFLNFASKIKAGDATPQEASAFGGLLTTVVAGKTAMDSFGMKYSLFGDTTPANNNYKKFSPGGSAISTLGGVANITSSPEVQQSCQAATTPEAGAAVNAALVANSGESFGATAILAGVNLLAGIGIEKLIEAVGPSLVDAAVTAIGPQAIKSLMETAFGDITKDAAGNAIAGESVGDAFASGASNVMGQTANAGGNMPLTVDQAVAYNNESQQVQLAYAQEDQATLSPLNPTSSNTFLGSIVNKLLPYYTNTSSIAGVLTNVASLATGSFNTLFQANAATDTSAQYKMCDDPMLSGVAAGPFCNISYGVADLDPDPEDVANYMLNNNFISGDTGDPVVDSEYADWLGSSGDGLCTDGTTAQANTCEIKDNDQKHHYFALYTIDHRVQKTMDGEDDASTAASSTADATIDQAHLYDPSTDIACAAGTDDAGAAQGYNNGQEIDIHLCSIPGTLNIDSSTPEVGQEAKVNSRVSGAWLALMKALATSQGETTVKITDSYRSMADQQAARAQYGSGAALPGYSNHQMGLAIDFQLPTGNSGSSRPGDPVWNWLSANAGTYGINQLSSEAWHWQPTGAHQ